MKIFNILKLIIKNLLVLICILLIIETGCFFARKFLDRDNVGWLVKKLGARLEVLRDDCLRFRTHPYLSHTHDHRDQCKILDGESEGPFVVYGDQKNSNYSKAILLLGGSTTDGFFQKYANGKTWPYFFNKKLKENKIDDVKIYNGGAGSYTSSDELLKLILDGPRINEKLKYVISLNGVNDIPGYRGINEYEEILPFWTQITLSMFSDGDWVKQGVSPVSEYFPSTMSLIKFISKKIFEKEGKFQINNLDDDKKKSSSKKENLIIEKKYDWQKSLLLKKDKFITTDEQWFYNVKLMYNISKELGADYYVFIQPALGINEKQIPKENTNDYNLYVNLDHKFYLPNIKDFYSKIIKKCQLLDYCFDLSENVLPDGNKYYDARHHNSSGNLELSNLIFEKIFNKKNNF